ISKNKDTLALGNISGAMVFQSCIPVTIGILSTPWILDSKALLSALLSVLSASVTYLYIKINGKLSPFPLLAGGLFYATFIVFLIAKGFH
ncbi:MAG TPA: sodium:calcium antiporter, partial [Clostridia bacterium]